MRHANVEIALSLCRHWWRPISSAGVERLFSMLTHIDVPSRSRMLAQLLHDVLYLMGNRKIVDELVKEGALRLGERPRSTAAPEAAATAAAAAVFAAASLSEDEEACLRGLEATQRGTKKARTEGPQGISASAPVADAAASPAPAARAATFCTVSLPIAAAAAAAEVFGAGIEVDDEL